MKSWKRKTVCAILSAVILLCGCNAVSVPDEADLTLEGVSATTKKIPDQSVKLTMYAMELGKEKNDDILSDEIMELRFWGIEGGDYMVNVDGSYYRDREMTDNWNDDDYLINHVCQYSSMPRARTV